MACKRLKAQGKGYSMGTALLKELKVPIACGNDPFARGFKIFVCYGISLLTGNVAKLSESEKEAHFAVIDQLKQSMDDDDDARDWLKQDDNGTRGQ
ncbi:hypothetical protein GOP47_0004797 [Adiantum capillus-veneris]|uniref:Uncharacterized protein n=1 Tax=Adiantum capillus-veneris TaxID=13818 RepID=A0A9D4V449_ADICA|nr:hypothetical protein GOP47_0004797 [Adiantum capillus-veneris]